MQGDKDDREEREELECNRNEWGGQGDGGRGCRMRGLNEREGRGTDES